MKNYKVLLSETQYYWVEVEATDEEGAEALVKQAIVDDKVLDTYEASGYDYSGYEVVDGCAELAD